MAVANVFFDVPNYGIPGCTNLLREKHARVGDGQFAMFLNRNRTRVKIMFNEQTMFTYASAHEITIEELKQIPFIVKGEWFGDKILKAISLTLGKPITKVSATVKRIHAA